MEVQLLHRPEPTDPKARRAVEWADVGFYIFRLAFFGVLLIMAAAMYGPAILTELR